MALSDPYAMALSDPYAMALSDPYAMALSDPKPKFKAGDLVRFVNTTGTQDWADPDKEYQIASVNTERPIALEYHEDDPDWFQIYYVIDSGQGIWEENLEPITDADAGILDATIKMLERWKRDLKKMLERWKRDLKKRRDNA